MGPLLKYWKMYLRCLVSVWTMMVFLTIGNQGWAEPSNNGLAVTFSSSGKSDTRILPNLWLFVPAGKASSPFVPAGEFTAHYQGHIIVDLRGDYTFQAELQGVLSLDINGATVLEATNSPTQPVIGKMVRLNKGTNSISAKFKSPDNGDAFFRVEWTPKGDQNTPIPLTSLTYEITPEISSGQRLLRGRELMVENRCLKCHTSAGTESGGMVELAYDAPSFDGIGSRRNFAWMRDWIIAPKKMRASARMPQVFHGAEAPEQAKAVAAYLSSLTTASVAPPEKVPSAEQIEGGKTLFSNLHCDACHITPGVKETDPLRNPLPHVASKFSNGQLANFLLQPDANYAWSRMPKYHLKPEEASQIADYLLSAATKPDALPTPTEAALITQGQKLVQTTGCLNCHSLKLENQFSTKTLVNLTNDQWKSGCVAATPESKAMNYNFSESDQLALKAFAESDRGSLQRHVGWEFSQRQQVTLKCVQCHGKFEGFPAFETIGGKMKPEWSATFIAGDLSTKIRPWIESRMPAFKKPAEALAQGLAMQHGLPPRTPEEPAIDPELAKIGQQMVSTVGGFSCISCHAVNELGATQVFESAGINFAYTAARIQKSFFHRWVRNPLSIDPSTKMPVYFSTDDKSPLADVLDGDGPKTREAFWNYFRLGEKMPPPPLQP